MESRLGELRLKCEYQAKWMPGPCWSISPKGELTERLYLKTYGGNQQNKTPDIHRLAQMGEHMNAHAHISIHKWTERVSTHTNKFIHSTDAWGMIVPRSWQFNFWTLHFSKDNTHTSTEMTMSWNAGNKIPWQTEVGRVEKGNGRLFSQTRLPNSKAWRLYH